MSAFLDLHRPGDPFVMPNPWDAGSARILVSLGARALATTSSGFAATLGRPDGGVTRDEAIAHAATIAAAVDVPVSADLENCFADDPAGVAETVRLAKEAGLAGCSVEDWSGSAIYDLELAVERVAAAVEAAGEDFVVTARAENLLRDRGLDDAITRLQRFQEAGAPVLFAPGAATEEQITAVIGAVDRPVNVLAFPDSPPVPRLAELGVARVSTGGALAFAAYSALVESGRELLGSGTYGYWALAGAGRAVVADAFAPRGEPTP
ncbi:2-Methylisocitrate lyase, PEP mutase family [Nocardioides terrae]|uniref:2-Methylisocitrate lyase, PEP mutase family n=1 Tax=Nocardioides terrae TaxID=574651 RepID=A0A1I1M1Q5_9ACTN|nr:isocitrate lyase/phosphoenolpyruvate mutase family protein [Nocardioides terrae]SFC79145.1 2-Methylisocitrate lyase, PEP mutase family [Nocardioides terrae]